MLACMGWAGGSKFDVPWKGWASRPPIMIFFTFFCSFFCPFKIGDSWKFFLHCEFILYPLKFRRNIFYVSLFLTFTKGSHTKTSILEKTLTAFNISKKIQHRRHSDRVYITSQMVALVCGRHEFPRSY